MPRPGTFSAKGRFDGHASSEVAPPDDMAPPRFVVGSTMRHVLVMTGTGAAGLIAIFLVDLVSLLYISWLKRRA